MGRRQEVTVNHLLVIIITGKQDEGVEHQFKKLQQKSHCERTYKLN